MFRLGLLLSGWPLKLYFTWHDCGSGGDLHRIRKMATAGTEECRKHWLTEVRGESFKIAGRIYERLLQPESLASVGLWSESELLGLHVEKDASRGTGAR